ncbi:MAG: CpsD/CapB family tyrosine-protein kinase [Chloroflexota bacterium]
MKLFRRNNSKTAVTPSSLSADESITLMTRDGSINTVFPEPTVQSIRQLIVQIENRTTTLPERIGITSAISKEGVTHIARALGTTIAHDLGSDVCIIEANWWAPAHEAPNGLGAIIGGKRNINDVIMGTNLPNLAYIPPGFLNSNERAIAARSDMFRRVLDDLNDRFEYLILDLPAISTSTAAIPLASLTDAVCLVVRQGVTSRNRVTHALEQLRNLNVVGITMNQVKTYTPEFLLKLLPVE